MEKPRIKLNREIDQLKAEIAKTNDEKKNVAMN